MATGHLGEWNLAIDLSQVGEHEAARQLDQDTHDRQESNAPTGGL